MERRVVRSRDAVVVDDSTGFIRGYDHGTEVQYIPSWQLGSSGNVTGLVGPDGGCARLISAGNSFVLFGDSLTEMCKTITTLTPGSEISSAGGVCTIARGSSAGLTSGQMIGLYRTGDTNYLGAHRITVTGVNTCTFPISTSAASQPALRAHATTLGMFIYNRNSDRSWWSWANAISGLRGHVLSVSAVGGDYTSDLLDRIDSDFLGVAPYRPIHATVWAGINDIINAVPVATVITNLENIYAQLLGSGINVVAFTLTPLATGHVKYNDQPTAQAILAVNRYIREKATETNGMFLCDAFAAVVNPTATTLSAASGMLATDGIHLSQKGARAIGAAFAPVLQALVPPLNRLVASAADSYGIDTGNSNLIDNPLMTGSGGGTTTGFTGGTVAASWTIGRIGAGSHTGVPSVVARSDGIGNNQKCVITFSAANEITEIKNTTSVHARVTEGDLIRMTAAVKWYTAVAALKSVRLLIFAQIGSDYPTSEALYESSTTYDKADFDGVLQTPTFRVPAGVTALNAKLYVTSASAGDVTIEFGRVSLVKGVWSEIEMI